MLLFQTNQNSKTLISQSQFVRGTNKLGHEVWTYSVSINFQKYQIDPTTTLI